MAEQTVSIKALLIDKLTAPLNGVRKLFVGLRNDVGELRNRLSPLTGQVAGLAASFLSLQAANKAIEEAKGAADAQRRLLGALRGNRDELDRITEVAGKLGEKFAIDDDDLVDLAATLINLGVSANDVDRTLEAVLRTAEATGQSAEAVAIAVAKFGQEGSGRLGNLVPELKRLEDQGQLAAKGVDVLLQKFGAVGEASDDFKQATRLTNDLNNALGEQGKEFIKVKVALLSGLIPAVNELTEFLKSDTGQGVLAVVIELAKEIGGLLPIVASIAATVAGIKLVAFLAPIAFLVAKVAIVGGIVVAIVAGVLELLGLLDPVLGFFTGIVEKVREWFTEFSKGNRSVEDVFDLVKTRVAQGFTFIKAHFFDPIFNVFQAFRGKIEGTFKFLFGWLIKIGGTIAEFLGKPFELFIRFVARQIDNLTGALAKGLKKAADFFGLDGGFADSIATDLEKKLEGVDIGETLTAKGDALIAEAKALLNAPIGNITEANKRGFEDAQKRIEKLEVERLARTDARAVEREKKKVEQARKELEIEKKTQTESLRQETFFQDRLEEIREGRNTEARDRIRKRALEDLEAQFEAEKITAERFIEERRRLELAPIDEQIAKRRQIINTIQEEIAKIVESKGAKADVHTETERLIQVELELQAVLNDRIDLEQELDALLADLQKKRAEKVKADAEKSANEIVQRLKDARSQLEKELDFTRGRREGGFIFSDEAAAKDEETIARFKDRFAALRTELDQVIEKNPELAASFAEVRAEIEKLSEVTREASETGIGDFFTGFEAGASRAITSAADLREAGLSMGEAFVDAAGDLAVGFTEADFSITKFFGNFLRQIGQALIKLALFRALASVFGFGTSTVAGGLVQGLNQGGPVLGFDSGGRVPGPAVNRDIVDAKLTPGEWVIRKPAVDHYGHAAIAALNDMLVPRSLFAGLKGMLRPINLSGRFAEGGAVPDGRSQESASSRLLVVDDQTAERIASMTERAMLRLMRENPDKYRTAIGAAAR